LSTQCAPSRRNGPPAAQRKISDRFGWLIPSTLDTRRRSDRHEATPYQKPPKTTDLPLPTLICARHWRKFLVRVLTLLDLLSKSQRRRMGPRNARVSQKLFLAKPLSHREVHAGLSPRRCVTEIFN